MDCEWHSNSVQWYILSVQWPVQLFIAVRLQSPNFLLQIHSLLLLPNWCLIKMTWFPPVIERVVDTCTAVSIFYCTYTCRMCSTSTAINKPQSRPCTVMHQVFLVQSPCVNSHKHIILWIICDTGLYRPCKFQPECNLRRHWVEAIETMRVFLLAFPIHANGYQYLLTLCKEYK